MEQHPRLPHSGRCGSPCSALRSASFCCQLSLPLKCSPSFLRVWTGAESEDGTRTLIRTLMIIEMEDKAKRQAP